MKRSGKPVKLNDTYGAGDTIRVLDRSRADLALVNRPVLRLDQGTTITLKGVKEERTSIVELVKGAAHFFSRVTRSLEVTTGFVNAGVEGTEFFMRVEEDKTFLSIFEGKVLASNAAGSLILTSGQSAIAEAGKAPVLGVVVRPRDAVQWTLYYPPVLYYRPADFQGLPENVQTMLKKSIEAYTKGDLKGAFDSIANVPEDVRDPRLFTYRAGLLLAVGRVDEAKADIEKALDLAPNNSDALALQSVIAVTQNEKDNALDLAKKSVEADPKSASARIALSYAQQANFDLEGARNSLEEAVKSNPENALAWARLAEIWLSFAELNKALEAAQKAVSLNPDLSRTQTVLGFAYLTQVKTGKSKEAFQKAIELDQADPLPRLGLGLAKIREGGLPKWDPALTKMLEPGLQEGTRDLETAVSLDPDNSLIRSYLGKAYYEKTEDKLATDQFDMAKKVDPMDPTPYFYDAIKKQTTNRPVEALHDLQKAIELNDNRAVYRSRLLLDADQAARSASLARIYTDLGFQQRALVEGWKSVNTDPSDFSGHRFLADTYSALPRHEIARVSELLVSQLLQPLNMTPIQPRLAESNLFLISAGGPGALSFNEFNPIFSRDGVTLQVSGLGGENKTWSGEGVLAGIYKNASFSVGYSHFDTDGWRKNADQKDDIANAFLQFALTPQTSIQGEYRYRNTEKGDLRSRFFPEDFSPGERNEEERRSYRLGLRHAFSPNSIALGSFIYEDADFGLKDNQPVSPILTNVRVKNPESAFAGELQHLFRSRYLNLTSGVGYAKIDGELKSIFGTIFPPPDDIIQDRISTDISHTNLYMYSYINPLKNLTITIGASGDFVQGDKPNYEDKNQFNPKFGLTWNPFPDTTLRGAVFRVLKRTLITNQTLEPTQVAGFNQFFDDFNGTEAWRYGAAIDQKFPWDLFGGVEWSKRDLEVPYLDYLTDPANPTFRDIDWKEYLIRSYLFWTPHPWLALRAEYQYERIERDERMTDGPKKMYTHRVPLGISFFHPSGLSASLKATYFHQEGEFVGFRDVDFHSGKDNFWTVDGGINYRLPKRYGLITVGVTNLFDKKFNFFEIDYNNPSIQPDRVIFAKITLALP